MCGSDERVEKFMTELLATGVVLQGEGGGEEGEAKRRKLRALVVREYLKLVEDGAFP